MKAIYKIIIFIAFIAMIGTTTAFEIEGGTITNNQINWHSFNIASGESAQFEIQDNGIENIQTHHNGGGIYHPDEHIEKPETYSKGAIEWRTIEPAHYEPEGYIPSINPKNINAYQYEDIEIE